MTVSEVAPILSEFSAVGELAASVLKERGSLRSNPTTQTLMTDQFCVVVWFEGQNELVDWFDTKAAAQSCAAAWNRQAEEEGTGSGVMRYGADDFFSVELAADWA